MARARTADAADHGPAVMTNRVRLCAADRAVPTPHMTQPNGGARAAKARR